VQWHVKERASARAAARPPRPVQAVAPACTPRDVPGIIFFKYKRPGHYGWRVTQRGSPGRRNAGGRHGGQGARKRAGFAAGTGEHATVTRCLLLS
jgi:hypothetical protein